MEGAAASTLTRARPPVLAYVELLKPITWFPPMWAFGCGLVSAGSAVAGRWWFIVGGIALAGPLVCGTSQIVNDWFDRDVDRINEPGRPIPSGRVPGRRALYFAIAWTLVSLAVAAMLGLWVFIAASVGLALAWAYSAPPFRLKRNGWYGNSAVAVCYEGLPWFTAAAVALGTLPDGRILIAAALYSVGAHGIMTLNDFKAVDGDRLMQVRSLPVQLGEATAARVACVVMALPQLVVVALLWSWQLPWHAVAVAALLALQIVCMLRLLSDPRKYAPWYNATGVTLYVSGMLVTAFALRAASGA